MRVYEITRILRDDKGETKKNTLIVTADDFYIKDNYLIFFKHQILLFRSVDENVAMVKIRGHEENLEIESYYVTSTEIKEVVSGHDCNVAK